MMIQEHSGKGRDSDASHAIASDLFSPFVREGAVDERLLRVLGLGTNVGYSGSLDTVLHTEEGTRFDLQLEATNGQRIFIDLKPSGARFETCDDDERRRAKLKDECEPYLAGAVDAKWLTPEAFCANYEVIRRLSYLGRYADSGVAFIFPRASEALMKSGDVIKQVVSKSLAPRVAILYLEYLVERILEQVAADEPLRRHYLAFRDRYVLV